MHSFQINGETDRANAPYEVQVEAGKEYWYCACGKSKNQPWCDGSLEGNGVEPISFVAEKTGSAWLCGCRMSETLPFATARIRSCKRFIGRSAGLYGVKYHKFIWGICL